MWRRVSRVAGQRRSASSPRLSSGQRAGRSPQPRDARAPTPKFALTRYARRSQRARGRSDQRPGPTCTPLCHHPLHRTGEHVPRIGVSAPRPARSPPMPRSHSVPASCDGSATLTSAAPRSGITTSTCAVHPAACRRSPGSRHGRPPVTQGIARCRGRKPLGGPPLRLHTAGMYSAGARRPVVR